MSANQNEYRVDLAELKIPQDAAERLESEIRQIVLKEIAKLDFKGDLLIKKLPGGTRGIRIRPTV